VLKGEGEATVVQALEAAQQDRKALHKVLGAVTLDGQGPPPIFVKHLDDLLPARDLLRHRRKYFIGQLDPCARSSSAAAARGTARSAAPDLYGAASRQVARTRRRGTRTDPEPGLFILDDVAFIQAEHGMKIGEATAARHQGALLSRDPGRRVLRNKEVFQFWKQLGLVVMFLGLEAIDEEGLKKFRKRVTLSKNFEALEFARSLDINVAVNIIADPSWDRERFKVVRDWAMEIPEMVNISVNTPYPGTETWRTEARKLTTRDYRLFDIQHAVLPTKLPLKEFYEELVATQRVLSMKHLGFAALRDTARIAVKNLLRGQTNFIRML
jgi:hopanoid C-3 methylase HpnR